MSEVEIEGECRHPGTGRMYPWVARYVARANEANVTLEIELSKEGKIFRDRRLITFDPHTMNPSMAVVEHVRQIIKLRV